MSRSSQVDLKQRARQLARARQREEEHFKSVQNALQKQSSGELRDIEQKFGTRESVYEDQFKASTVGLQSADDYRRKREMVSQKVAEDASRRSEALLLVKLEKKRARKRAHRTLSFADGEEDEEEPSSFQQSGGPVKRRKKKKNKKKKEKKRDSEKLEHKAAVKGKNPFVETSFLPDQEREKEEAKLRESLKKEWQDLQEKVKRERIEITYSYWDGSGHRKRVTVEKGCTIGDFLGKCRKGLMHSFHELQRLSSDQLMYIKEDLIIPHHYTFYDLIVTKARGKSGPLFHFDVHDDVRLVQDARVEKDESHAGKVVTRQWYDRNKHIFPSSRWEVYDPSKDYGTYKIKG